MTLPRRWPLAAFLALLTVVAVFAVLVTGRPGSPNSGGNPMVTTIPVAHVRVESDRSFDEVTRALERQLGRFDPEVYKALAADGDTAAVRARIAAMAGPSGFMLFGTSDHGSLLRLAGQKRKVVQYVLGNPLFALEMTRYDVRASLYAPLRVLVYEDERGKTCVEYDRPSSLFGQFGNERVNAMAAELDRKLEALVAGSAGK
jgi:uncharacterized protein (DUF302 family)